MIADVAELQHQLEELVGLIERTGQELVNQGAVIEEYIGSAHDMREIIKRNKRIGTAMLSSMERTRKLLEMTDD